MQKMRRYYLFCSFQDLLHNFDAETGDDSMIDLGHGVLIQSADVTAQTAFINGSDLLEKNSRHLPDVSEGDG